MKCLAVFAFVLVAALAHAKPNTSDSPVFGYHSRYGIKRAEEIKALEDRALRVTGGAPAADGQFPYQAGLLISLVGFWGRSVCGASLLTENRLVTAAHCWFDGVNQAYEFEVALGSSFLFSGGERRTTTSVEMHYEWNPFTAQSDIAMIRLSDSVTFNNFISPITLPTNYVGQSFSGAVATVSGFGLTSDWQASIPSNAFLSFAYLPVIDNSVCALTFGQYILESTLCIRGPNFESSCSGDSGGPVTVTVNGERILAGIVSFGTGSCERGDPTANARVTSFLDWISVRL